MADLKGLLPEVQAGLEELERRVSQAGGRLRVNSAYRSPEKQKQLYANRHRNPYPVAKPGTSRHEKGTALDLGVTGMTQGQLAEIASEVGFKWAGNKDRVHFDFEGGNPDSFSEALSALKRKRSEKQQDQATLREALAVGMRGVLPQAGSSDDLSAALAIGRGETPAPEQPKGILDRARDYASNWWNSVVHGQGPGGEALHPTERFGAAIAPGIDAADFIGGGFATAFTGNPQGGLIRWGVIKPFNALGAAVGELGRQTVAQQGFQPEDIWTRARQGFNEEISGANFITETLRGNRELGQWIDQGGDAWTKWADFGAGLLVGTKIPTPLAPVFKYGGKGIRIGLDRTASGLTNVAGRFQPGTRARVRAENLATGFIKLTDSSPEFRAVRDATHERMLPFSSAQQRLTRITNTVKNIGRKLKGDENVKLYGDLLEHHPDPNIRAGAMNPGYLPTQILLHGAEAGSEGAFFNHPHQVLDIAADLGLPVKPLAQAIDEYKALSEEAGQRMVESKLLDEATFKENAGYWVRRFYRANLEDAGAREALINEMVAKGVDSTRSNQILMALQQSGESGPPGQVGVGLKTKGNTGRQFTQKRKLTDAEERLEFLPDYNAIDQVAGSLLGQFKAAAIHEVFETMAGNEALSAANLIKDYGKGRKLDFSQTPRIKRMLADVGEKIKSHQERMTNRLEQEYATRTKWADEQASRVARLEQSAAEHAAKQPVKPVPPASVEPIAPRFLAGPSIVGGAKPRVSAAAVKRGSQAARSAINEGRTIGYVEALDQWQRENASWRLKASKLEADLADAQAELSRRQSFLDETDAEVGKWFEEAEKLERRHDLLNGAEPTDLHANDALTAVEEKLGFQVVDPAERAQWTNKWKEEWVTRGEDIFDPKNVNPPIAPKGVPTNLAEAMDQNIFPALALDESLSAGKHAFTQGQQPPGWSLWEPKGNRSYGAMNNRWGPTAIRHFIEDAIDPSRLENSLGVIGTPLKFFSDHFKALKLYYNPGTKLGIEINSFWEAKATVNAAGVRFNPRAYIEGMKEYKRWVEGEGDVTPAVEAMLAGVREAGSGFMTGMLPGELPTVGQEGFLARLKDNQKKKFVEVQQFPKAGAANVLIKAGKSPMEAGMLAEQGFGARGGMGGIETHGVMQIAEGLNRYGIAIFTSYPLHSINRFMQLMAHRPDVLMTYPVVRHYLLNEAGPEARERDERGEVRPTMVPIPGFKNDRGEPMWISVANLIPHGGAQEPLQFGGIWSPVQRAYQAHQRTQQYGASPDNALGEGARALKNAILPAALGSGAEALGKAFSGEKRNPSSLEAETPLTAISRIANFPISSPENRTDREMFLEMDAIPAREAFMNLYIERVSEGKERPRDYSGYLKNADAAKAMDGQKKARMYLAQLLADKSISSEKSKTMIRRQIDWIMSINKAIDTQYSQLGPMTGQEEMQDAEPIDQYSDPSYQ